MCVSALLPLIVKAQSSVDIFLLRGFWLKFVRIDSSFQTNLLSVESSLLLSAPPKTFSPQGRVLVASNYTNFFISCSSVSLALPRSTFSSLPGTFSMRADCKVNCHISLFSPQIIVLFYTQTALLYSSLEAPQFTTLSVIRADNKRSIWRSATDLMPDTILIKVSKIITLYYCHMALSAAIDQHPYLKPENSAEFQNYRKHHFLKPSYNFWSFIF